MTRQWTITIMAINFALMAATFITWVVKGSTPWWLSLSLVVFGWWVVTQQRKRMAMLQRAQEVEDALTTFDDTDGLT